MNKLKYSMILLCIAGVFACGGGRTTSQETVKDTTQVVKESVPERVLTDEPIQMQETTGVFLGIEQGDYFYFKIRPEGRSEEKSFMVLKGDETYDKIVAQPEKFQGKKIKVYWQAKKQNIPEAGGEIDIEEYIKAEIL